MKFSELALHLERLSRMRSRNEMTAELAALAALAPADEVDKICYLLLGELLPPYRGVEFNIAEKLMIRVLAGAFEHSAAEVLRRYKSKGDLGDVAHDLARRHRPSGRDGPSVTAVYGRMLAVAREAGEGSQERKVRQLAELFSALDARSVVFVARIPLGKLRLGFSEATLLDALSVMERGDKSARPVIERAYNVTADVGAIARRLKTGGLRGLGRLMPTPGVPLRPALAERVSGPEEATEKAGAMVGVEPKLDGLRVQIHIWPHGRRTEVALFSRNLENTTPMFPEIVEAARHLPVRSAILDGETIGYNPKTGRFLSFQETVKRKRKHDIEAFAKKIPLTVFIFDVLYHNGRSLLELPFRERRMILEGILTPHARPAGVRAKRAERAGGARTRTLYIAEDHTTDDPAVIRAALNRRIASGLEGLVLKNLAAPYEAGKRGFHWMKLKAASAELSRLRGGGERRAESQALDTIDCLVMGAYAGRGKRTGFGVGGFLLGVRGTDDRYYSISRLGTGLSDEQFREAHRRLTKLTSAAQPKEYVVDAEMAPDIWASPEMVVEVLADEVTLSPRHTAGRAAPGRGAPGPLGKARGRGYSLRFPRLVRFRDDKSPQDVTAVAEVRDLYRRQNVATKKEHDHAKRH